MKPVSGTSLSTATRYCLRALDHRDNNTPRDERIFAAGIAAHQFLEVAHIHAKQTGEGAVPRWHLEEIAKDVAVRLATKGRVYDGKSQPPLPMDKVQEGVDLGVRFASIHPFDVGAEPEQVLAVDENWNPVEPTSKTAIARGVLDVLKPPEQIEIDADDGLYATVLRVDDYKKAFHAGEAETDSKQMRLYALLAKAHYPEINAIQLRIANLSTTHIHERWIWIDDEGGGAAMLERWRQEVMTQREIMEYRGSDGKRPASPGVGCVACPYLLHCDAAKSALEARKIQTPVELANLYAVATATRESAKALLLDVCNHGYIETDKGRVGFITKHELKVRDDAPEVLLSTWQRSRGKEADPTNQEWRALNADSRALVKSLSITSGNVKNFANSLYPKHKGQGARALNKEVDERRKSIVSAMTDSINKVQFGIESNEGLDGDSDAPVPSEAV